VKKLKPDRLFKGDFSRWLLLLGAFFYFELRGRRVTHKVDLDEWTKHIVSSFKRSIYQLDPWWSLRVTRCETWKDPKHARPVCLRPVIDHHRVWCFQTLQIKYTSLSFYSLSLSSGRVVSDRDHAYLEHRMNTFSKRPFAPTTGRMNVSALHYSCEVTGSLNELRLKDALTCEKKMSREVW
jgi:hypothetical protein